MVAQAPAGEPTSVTNLPAMAQGRRWPLVLLLGSLSAFGPLCIDMYLPGLPDLADALGSTASAAQLTLTACLIGLAAGQVVAGTLSDRFGRRRPLLLGVAAFVVASLVCAVAPNIWCLVAARLVQGAAGAAGIVIARAMVRDLYSGAAAARFFVTLMLVNGAAPILAPVLGGQLLHVMSWRGIFVVLAGIGLVLVVASAVVLRETLPPERRHSGGFGTTVHAYRTLLRDSHYLGCVLTSGCTAAAMFAYISGSPFVLQDLFGISPQVYSLLFGINAIGIVTAGQVSARLLRWWTPFQVLRAGVAMTVTGAVLLLVAAGLDVGLPLVLPALFITVASNGVVSPNASALALEDHAASAGSASALLGLAMFSFGGIAAPLVGLGGAGSDLPMALVIAGFASGALLALLTLLRRPQNGRTA